MMTTIRLLDLTGIRVRVGSMSMMRTAIRDLGSMARVANGASLAVREEPRAGKVPLLAIYGRSRRVALLGFWPASSWPNIPPLFLVCHTWCPNMTTVCFHRRFNSIDLCTMYAYVIASWLSSSACWFYFFTLAKPVINRHQTGAI